MAAKSSASKKRKDTLSNASKTEDAPQGTRASRVALLRGLEAKRKSRVLAYICSDRGGAAAQIGEDSVRPMYEHVRPWGKVPKIDLYLYSRGGSVEVPWRIVSMLREHCDTLGVLIPYRAHSAATLIALGCDEIVMGAKAELGPIDPALGILRQEGGTQLQEEVRVEDIMSYVEFIRKKVGLGDQSAIADSVKVLAEKLQPWFLGSIYRTHSHIRMVARMLLACHNERVDEQKANIIVESLAEKIYSHGHAIGRTEAVELGLPVCRPDAATENAMWQLLEAYESAMIMTVPLDVDGMLGPTKDEAEEPMRIAMIESAAKCSAFQGVFKVKRIRQPPQQVNININLGVSLPPGIDPNVIPQEVMRQFGEQVNNAVPGLVAEQTKKQSAVIRTEGRLSAARWVDVTKSEA